MSILRFASGFNIEWDPDIDIHALQRALDHFVRVQDDPGLNSTYHMDVEFTTGRVRLMLQELALIEVSDLEPTLWIVGDDPTEEAHRLIMVPTGGAARIGRDSLRRMWQDGEGLLPNGNRWVWRAAPRSRIVADALTCPMCVVCVQNGARQGMVLTQCEACGQRLQIADAEIISRQIPASQHRPQQAMDLAVPERPTHVTIHTRRGPTRITSAADLPALRQWFEANILDGEELAIPARDVVLDLPDAGRVHLGPEEIRRLGAALINARQIERGAPLRAVANVDGQNYEQGAGEALPDYEQRVIQDIMLRRGRDLMRERGLSPQEAADEVRRTLQEQGVERLAQDMHQVQEPTDEVDRRLRTLTQEEHQTLAQAVAEYYIVDERSDQADELIRRVGLTEPMIRWFNVQIVESMNRLPIREKGPTLMEVWRD